MMQIKSVSLFFVILCCLAISVVFAEVTSSTNPVSRKLIVGVLNDPPYLIKEPKGEWSGLNVDIWKSIVRDLNYSYEFKEMAFHDILDAVKDNQIDLSIGAFFVLAERQKFIDNTFPFGNSRLAVATLPEKMQHPWWTAIKTVVSWATLKVLGMLALALCVLGFILWLTERKHNPDHFGGGMLKGIGSGIYWVGSTMASGVCFGITLQSFTARMLGLIWMFLCTLVLSALIASLSASLYASRSMTDSVSEETLRTMHLGGVAASAENSVLEELGCKYAIFKDEEAALQAVLDKKIDGFLYDEITLHYYQEHQFKNKISVYPSNLKRFLFAFALPKESPLRRPINYALLKLMEKPDWVYLLKRYGFQENFEVITVHRR